ncbi:MAG: Spy/CpxP family protein refolding chaperone [Nitrospirae bacterium]|nr:Spy/CpxP family protein refolding chaperone [Nitrospirota bacterium]
MLVRRTVRAVLVAMMLTLTITGTLMAGVGDGLKGTGDTEHILLKALVQLNLTDAQKSAIAGILKGHKDELKSDIQAVVDARVQLFEAIHASIYDETKVRALSRVLANKEEELAVLRAKIVNEVNSVLTVEQKAILEQAREDFAAMIKTKVEKILTLINTWISKNS